MDDMALERVLRGDTGRSGPAIGRMMAEVLTGHFDRPLYASATAIDAELEGIERIIQKHDLELGEAKLKELETLRGRQVSAPSVISGQRRSAPEFSRIAGSGNRPGANCSTPNGSCPRPRPRINEALGYELTGDRAKAHALATSLRQEFPHVVRLAAIWVRTSPQDAPFESVVNVTATLAKDHEDLNLALAHRALLTNRIPDALSFARRATELGADSPNAWFVLGMAKHAEAFAGAAGIQSATCVRPLTITTAPFAWPANRKRRGWKRRFASTAAIGCDHLLGAGGAEADYTVAIELARPDQGLRTSYASYLIELGRPDEALANSPWSRVSRPASGSSTRPRRGTNATPATTAGRRSPFCARVIASGASDRWDDAHILLVQWAAESKNTDDVREEIMGSRIRESNPLVFHALRGWLSSADGDREAAASAFDAACNAVTDGSSREYLYPARTGACLHRRRRAGHAFAAAQLPPRQVRRRVPQAARLCGPPAPP